MVATLIAAKAYPVLSQNWSRSGLLDRDFTLFSIRTATVDPLRCGISTIAVGLEDLLAKRGFVQLIQEFCETKDLDMLLLMTGDGHSSPHGFAVYFHRPRQEKRITEQQLTASNLKLKEFSHNHPELKACLRTFYQENTSFSRASVINLLGGSQR